MKMSTELIAVLAVGVSQTLLMVTLAGFLLAAQRGLRQDLANLSKSVAELARSLADVRERLARVEGLIDGVREFMAARRRDETGRTDAA